MERARRSLGTRAFVNLPARTLVDHRMLSKAKLSVKNAKLYGHPIVPPTFSSYVCNNPTRCDLMDALFLPLIENFCI